MQFDTVIQKTKRAALVFRAFNHPLRQRILKFLTENPGCSVTLVYVSLKLEQSVASQHLAILRRAGLITFERDGKFIHYTVNSDRVNQLATVADSLIQSGGERHPHRC